MSHKTLAGSNPRQSFIRFIFLEKNNRKLLLIATAATILEFILFKFLYPFADFFSDSYSYIYAASADLKINIWPIGYSKFLNAIHLFTHSDTVVVSIQYFFLELSSLYFFFTLLYFYNPGKSTKTILYGFLFFNPLFLYVSNYINSDPLFAALSLLWFTELIWVINRPKIHQIITHGMLLFFAFTVRNNAYYYPFVAALAFLSSKQSKWAKLSGIALPILFIGIFIIQTKKAAYELTGTSQFSLFTGWILANNALYMYGHLQIDSTQLPTAATRELDRYSRTFYSKIPEDFDNYLLDYVANFFIREPDSPLKQYFKKNYRYEDELQYVVNWGKASVVYGDYGRWLIKHYPYQFAKYFMLLNTKNYFFPPLEKLEVYNLGQDQVDPIAQDWFDYKTPNVTAISTDAQAIVLFLFPYIFFFLNIFFTGSLVWLYIKRKKMRLSQQFKSILFLAASLIVVNFCFSIFATIIVLRYEFFPMIILLTVSFLLVEALENTITNTSKSKTESNNSGSFKFSEV